MCLRLSRRQIESEPELMRSCEFLIDDNEEDEGGGEVGEREWIKITLASLVILDFSRASESCCRSANT